MSILSPITTFSGAHPYRPQCLLALLPGTDDAVEITAVITGQIATGTCPRCTALLPDSTPIRPAGSRVTPCRCLPVCGDCGGDEALLTIAPEAWPVDGVAERAAGLRSQMRPAILHGTVVVTEDGVTPVRGRPHPGGWAEFGFNDNTDRAEVAQ